jgi:hypothetical protein
MMKLALLTGASLLFITFPLYSQQTVEIDWLAKKATSQPSQIQSTTKERAAFAGDSQD